MPSSIIVDGAPTPIRGQYQLSTSTYMTAQAIIAALLVDKAVRVDGNVVGNGLVEAIQFVGGNIRMTKESQFVSGEGVDTIAIPRNSRLLDRYAVLLFAVLLAKFGEAAIPLENQYLTRVRSIISPLGYCFSEESGYLVVKIDPNVDRSVRHLQVLISSGLELELGMLLSVMVPERTTVFKANGPLSQSAMSMLLILVSLGGQISLEENRLEIQGVTDLRPSNLFIANDINEAVWICTLAILTHGEVEVMGVSTDRLTQWLAKLNQLGVEYKMSGDKLRVWHDAKDTLIPFQLTTHDLDLPVDWLLSMILLATRCAGESIFTDLFGQIKTEWLDKLKELGAELSIKTQVDDQGVTQQEIHVFGPTSFTGGLIKSSDLFSALLTVTIAIATTDSAEVVGVEQIQEVYPKFLKSVHELGARFKLVEFQS